MSSPKTQIRPASGFRRPSASFRIVLLPEPATPKSALVSPRARRKEIPSSTTLRSNASSTSSKTTASPEPGCPAEDLDSRGRTGVDILMKSAPQENHQEPGDKYVDSDDQNHRGYDCFRSCASHALRSAFGRQPVITPDCCHDKSKHHGLC